MKDPRFNRPIAVMICTEIKEIENGSVNDGGYKMECREVVNEGWTTQVTND